MGAVFAGAVSPGPSFILVCRTAMLHSRKGGIAAAMGMGVGSAIFSSLALFGLAAVLKEVPSLHLTLRLIGGAYLLYLACRIWSGATQSFSVQAAEADSNRPSLLKVFGLSLMTQISNPKTAVFYGSIFTALLPSAPSPGLLVALVIGSSCIDFVWYTLVATLFSIRKPRDAYISAKSKIDRVLSAILGVLGGRLVFEAMN